MGLVWIWIRIQTILGIRIQICLLSSILIWIPWILWWIPWILLRKIDCCNKNTGCGYLKNKTKTINKCQNKQTYIYPALRVEKYLLYMKTRTNFYLYIFIGVYKIKKDIFFSKSPKNVNYIN